MLARGVPAARTERLPHMFNTLRRSAAESTIPSIRPAQLIFSEEDRQILAQFLQGYFLGKKAQARAEEMGRMIELGPERITFR